MTKQYLFVPSIQLTVLLSLVNIVCCWQYYTQLTDLFLENSVPATMTNHSEYIFGNCRRKDITFYTRTHLNHIDILGKPIVRGWIVVPRIPVCIRLRAVAYESDTFRSTAWGFQFCVPRITYCHSGTRTVYHYYEWYIPIQYEGGMNWDIFFFGPYRIKWW